MAEVISALKLRMGADSSNFKKGLSEGEKAARQFKNEASSAIDQFAAAFGINMKELRGSMESFKSSVLGLSSAAKASAAGAGVLTKALQFLKVALISTGIGALIVALGSLVSYFTKTQRGAEAVQRVMAGFKAIFDVLIDRVSKFGEGLFKIVTGDFKGGWDALKDSVQGVGTELVNETKQAVGLRRSLQELERAEMNLLEVHAKRTLEISKLRNEAEKQSYSDAQRAEMLRKAMDLEKQSLNENIAIQKERVRITEESVNMGESMIADERRVAEEKAKLYDLETQYLNSTRRMLTKEQGLAAKANKELTVSYRELRDEQQKQFEQSLEIRKQFLPSTAEQQPTMEPVQLMPMTLLDPDQISAFEEQMYLMRDMVIDISGEINEAMNSMAVGFGEAIGNMISGAGGFQNFGAIILGPLADMAIQVGKIAIGTGIAIEGIKKAFQSMNPAAAIAAGIALVALGTVVKGALSNAASNRSSNSTFSTSGTYDSRGVGLGSPQAKVQPVTVNVIGQTQIKNKDIYIAFKNAENNFRLTT